MKHEIGTSRSYKYQDALRQSTYSDDEWKTISTLHPNEINAIVNDWVREQLLDYDKQLEQMMWKLIDTKLTPYQINMCIMLKLAISQGEGQQFIADKLGINQSSVVKALKGNLIYLSDGVVKRYGGIATKLAKAISTNEEMQDIIQVMSDLGADELSPRTLPHWACFHKLA